MRPKILIAEPDRFSPRALAALTEWAEVDARRPAGDSLRAAFENYEIVWLRLGFRVTSETVRPPARCRIVATPVTGLDHIDLEACKAAGITVVSLRGETEFLREIRATAELTVALALALLRRLPAACRSVLGGHWDRDQFQGRELYGKTVAVIGMGRLGRITAGYFRAFGTRVIGFDPYQAFPEDLAVPVAALPDAVSQADVVSVHVSYSAETRRLINAGVFSAMKRGAVLVNTSRGGVIDEFALLDALRTGKLAGAALDVLDGEPDIRADNPLVAYAREHDNLIITPHIGGNTVESFEKTEVFLAQKVREAWKRLDKPET
ncbi:MAG: hydroxyacid dehydrogenase [Verrucomicrobia bacterium]|nr:hydroxyacid dehydrogenase [Verrucomicrobiota bacterium]